MKNGFRCLCWLLLLAAVGGSGLAAEGPAEVRGGQPRPKIGLALSGGGAKGIAHIGVLKVLEELGVPVDYVAGTSMGAIIGGSYASGITIEDLEEIALTTDWDDVLQDKPSRRELAFRRKQDDLRYLADLEIGFSGGKLRWPGGVKAGQKLIFMLQTTTLPVAGIDDFDNLPIPFRAVATDIVSGDMVVLAEGDLVKSLRASMAIPAVFSPVELDGRLLVDGAAANNLPVDVVRAMGADVVIAIDISSQLASREEIDSLIAIVGQSMALQTRKNMEAQLAAADFVITPDVSGFGVLEFSAVGELIARGAEQTRAHAEQLRRWAVDEPSYRRHREAQLRPRRLPERVAWVRVEGNELVDDRIIAQQVRLRAGDPLDLDALSEDLGRLYGLGDFEIVNFDLEHNSEGTGVVIRVQEKPWRPNYFQLGFFFDSDLDTENTFSILINLTFSRLNPKGGEWRNDLQFGRERLVASELFQPLDFRGGWFVAPSVELERSLPGFFEDGEELAELDVRRATVAVDLGHQFGKHGELRLGLERGRAKVGVATGVLPPGVAGTEVDLGEVDFGGVVFQGTYDQLDSSGLPHHGGFARGRAFVAFDALGADDEYNKLEVQGIQFLTRGRHTFLGGLRMGWSPGGELPVYDEFTLGGFLSLSGFNDDELRGQNMGVARLGYYYRLFGAFHLGGWLEAGNVWDASDDFGRDLIGSSTLLLGADTLAGPIYFAYGVAEGGNSRIYVTLGRSL